MAYALFNLSRFSVWWLHLGIAIERIKPGHPQQNGRHDRMHLTLKKEATRRQTRILCHNRAASMPSFTSSTRKDRTRRST